MQFVQTTLDSGDEKDIDAKAEGSDLVNVFQKNFLAEKKSEKKSFSRLWKGNGASPGQVEGPVKVIDDPGDFRELDKQTILVCRTAFRELMQILPEVSGLVTDRGGILASALVWARELGVPAVVGVGNLVERVKDGDRIRVNGWEGIVEVIAE